MLTFFVPLTWAATILPVFEGAADGREVGIMNYKNRLGERNLLAGIGIYHVILGLIFGIVGEKLGIHLAPRVPMIVFILGGARDLLVGILIIFCAYGCKLRRAGVISSVAGLSLLALIAMSYLVFGHFNFWTLLRTLGAIFLIGVGAMFVRQAHV